MSRKPSDLTVTDLFCGAGGSSIGATEAGGRMNRAIVAANCPWLVARDEARRWVA